ncbi:MAG: hypothetical protein IJR54_06525 [Oscillibacter sp.]|nr:hypothetical protein [Oscillibacter sp.]
MTPASAAINEGPLNSNADFKFQVSRADGKSAVSHKNIDERGQKTGQKRNQPAFPAIPREYSKHEGKDGHKKQIEKKAPYRVLGAVVPVEQLPYAASQHQQQIDANGRIFVNQRFCLFHVAPRNFPIIDSILYPISGFLSRRPGPDFRQIDGIPPQNL